MLPKEISRHLLGIHPIPAGSKRAGAPRGGAQLVEDRSDSRHGTSGVEPRRVPLPRGYGAL